MGEFQRQGRSDWELLVPLVLDEEELGDRPDGHNPRDSHIGHKRIDVPEWPDSKAAAAAQRVRFNCIRSIENRHVKLRSFSLHHRDVPWERSSATRLVV